MPLTARVKDTGERISSLDFKTGHEIRLKYKKGDLISPYPDCDTIVTPRDRDGFVLHFVHATAPETSFNHHPESPEHQRGKRLIAEVFAKELEPLSDIKILFEYPIGNRIADVAVVYPTGWVLVGECQLAAITTDELQQRTDDYAANGCDVIWWLGGKADTITNREWTNSLFGECRIINYRMLSVRPSRAA